MTGRQSVLGLAAIKFCMVLMARRYGFNNILDYSFNKINVETRLINTRNFTSINHFNIDSVGT